MNFAGILSTWFLVFITYSVVGWLMEMVVVSTINKRVVSNRGFLIGPVCPIYGFGAIFITLLLHDATNLVEIFLVAALGSAVLEYITSFVMEKLFRVRWWDYSEKRINLHGRICLEATFYFGIMGLIIVKISNPLLFGMYDSLSETVRIGLAIVLLIVMISDILISLWLINVCRVTVGTVQVDATEEITERVRNILMDKGRLNRRLIKAFPSMKVDRNEAKKAQIHTQTKAKVKAIKQGTKTQTKAMKAQTTPKAQVKLVKTKAKAEVKAVRAAAKVKVKSVKQQSKR